MPSHDIGRVIVTGGASGLGAAIASAIEARGATPIVFDLNEPPNGYAREVLDLSDTRAAEAAVERVVAEHGGLEGVVTAAGTDACGTLDSVAPDAWERVIAVNLLGTAAVVRAALPHLERSAGRVVTVGSTLGLKAVSDATAYCASKFGVVGFSRALATEWAGRVGVTMLIPGGMETHFFDGREEKYKPPPDMKLAPPEDVADAVVFALTRPAGVELREMVVATSTEPSWP
jgi:NAD(P)-dependent dehydrogenase (short-subunit alcohol dehydrogenase family)